MDLSDVVSYLVSSKAKVAMLIPDENIVTIDLRGLMIDSEVLTTEDQIDNIALSRLDTLQTSDLNEHGYTSVDLAVGNEFISMDIYLESGKIRVVIEIMSSFAQNQIYNYSNFKNEVGKRINQCFCSVAANSDALSEWAFLSSNIEYCSANNLNLVTVNSNLDNWADTKDTSRKIMNLGNDVEFILRAGVAKRFASNKNVLLINLGSIYNDELLRRAYMQASRGFNKLILVFRLNDSSRFSNFFNTISSEFYGDRINPIFCESLAIDDFVNDAKNLILLAGEVGDNNFVTSQLLDLFNKKHLSLESLKSISERSSIIDYREIINAI
jgi:hypothetical protein